MDCLMALRITKLSALLALWLGIMAEHYGIAVPIERASIAQEESQASCTLPVKATVHYLVAYQCGTPGTPRPPKQCQSGHA